MADSVTTKIATELVEGDLITNQGLIVKVTGKPRLDGPRLVIPTDRWGDLHKVPQDYKFKIITQNA